MAKVYTHTGYIRGRDNRTPSDYRKRVVLRELKNYWEDHTGCKWSKSGDVVPREIWSRYALDISSITSV